MLKMGYKNIIVDRRRNLKYILFYLIDDYVGEEDF